MNLIEKKAFFQNHIALFAVIKTIFISTNVTQVYDRSREPHMIGSFPSPQVVRMLV